MSYLQIKNRLWRMYSYLSIQIPFLMRWRARLEWVLDSGKALNRRVDVENYLLDCASGKRSLPDTDKCRELAYKLGTENE